MFGEEKEVIFEGYIMLFEDEELEEEILVFIKNDKMYVDNVIYIVIEE